MNGTKKAHAGVVDENVERAEGGFSLFYERSNVGRAGNVGTLSVNTRSRCAEFIGGGFERLRVTSADGDRRAHSRKFDRDGFSDAAIRTCDQGGLAGKRSNRSRISFVNTG